MIGSLAETRPDVLRRIVAEGHEVGNHSWSHPRLARDCDDERVRVELVQTSAAIEGIIGAPLRRFRCPYFDVDDRVEAIAATIGLKHTTATVAPPDWHPTVQAAFISTVVLQLAQADGIVALHDGIPPGEVERAADTRQATLDAVAAFVPRLRERGYECVTASALLDGPG